MEIPVYLFSGFLESGKTTFLQESLEDEYFNDGEPTLVLICEEGIEELSPEKFAQDDVFIELIDSQELLSSKKLAALTKQYSAERVLIEYNGMWKMEELIKNSPDSWVLYQNMMFADSGTFLNYNANMRELVADKLRLCDCVVFNRFRDDMDKMEFHKIVRTFNRKADILYEYSPDRVEQDDIEDPLPYDMEADTIEIDDDDYAVWYRDVNEETTNYEGKTVKLKGRILTGGGLPKDCFIVGRHVMTCCVEDIEFCGVVCRLKKDDKDNTVKGYENGDWVEISAVIKEENHKAYKGEAGPVLNILQVKSTEEPEEEVAVFY